MKTSHLCFILAIILALSGVAMCFADKSHWGWFLFVAFLCALVGSDRGREGL